MRVVRALSVALLTAFAGSLLALPVGDYLTRLAHVPEMEGQRGMTIFFLCVPLGFLSGLVIGIICSVAIRRGGPGGFFVAQGWSLLVVCGIAGLLGGVPYLLSDKPPRIDGKRLTLEFELRAPTMLKIRDRPDGYSIRVCLYTDNRQSRYAFIDWQAIAKEDETWSDWIFATQRADLSPVSDSERMALRYRVQPIDD